MAHSSSAKKRIRQNTKRRALNRWRKEKVRVAIRGFNEALKEGDTEKAATRLRDCEKQLDRIAAKGTIHKKTAARKISRLAKTLNRLPKASDA